MTDADVAGLLAAAVAEREDEDACVALIERLAAHRDVAAVIAAVEPLMTDPDVHTREVAIDVYGSAGLRDISGAERRRRVARLLALLDAGDLPWEVLESIAYAWGHLWVQEGAERIAALAGHPEERVREAVCKAIAHCDAPAAIAALRALSADAVDEVRDWATFGLGAMDSASRETPEVVAALVARLDDPYVPARDEAIHGLALRRDPRAIDPLVAMVRDGWEGRLLEESLMILATTFPDDPRLIAALPACFDDGVVPDELRLAARQALEWRDETLSEEA